MTFKSALRARNVANATARQLRRKTYRSGRCCERLESSRRTSIRLGWLEWQRGRDFSSHVHESHRSLRVAVMHDRHAQRSMRLVNMAREVASSLPFKPAQTDARSPARFQALATAPRAVGLAPQLAGSGIGHVPRSQGRLESHRLAIESCRSQAAADGRECRLGAAIVQTSVCSDISRASSTSMPR